MARSMLSTYAFGASDTCHGWAAPLSWLRRQFTDMAAQPHGVAFDFRITVGVHHGVVPGGHHLAVLRLGRIPVGRDVAFGSLKDHQRLARFTELAAMRIDTGEMTFDQAVLAPFNTVGRWLA